MWGGVWGVGHASSPEIFFDFLSGNGAFWCILGACFNVMLYKACKTESKSSFVCQLPIGQLSHMADVSSMISYTYIRVSSQPVRHTCSLYYLTIGVYRKKQWEQRSRCIKKRMGMAFPCVPVRLEPCLFRAKNGSIETG